MTTQSVKTQAANLFGNTSGSVSTKGKQTGNAFELLIGKNMKAGQDIKVSSYDVNGRKAPIKGSDSKADDKNSNVNSQDAQTKKLNKADTNEAKDATKTGNAQAADKASDKEPVKTDTAVKTDKTDATAKDENPVDQQLVEQINTMLQNIQQAIMDLLGLSKDQLNQLMTEQGINTADLLQPENLQKLVLANSGQTDISAALTDESLADTMKQLMQTVDQIKKDAAIPLTDDQIKSVLQQASAQSEDFTPIGKQEETVPLNTPKPVETSVNGQSAKMDDQQAKQDTGTQKEVTVEVTRLAETKESSSQSQAGTGSEDGKELKQTDPFQMFVDHMVKATQEIQIDTSGNTVKVTELREIVNQIVDRIKVIVKPDQTSMELQLNPEELGKVNLNVQSKNGVMTAQFVVQNEVSKEAIESQIGTLKETLNQQGIKVDAIDVTVAGYSFEQKGQAQDQGQPSEQKNTGRKISLEDALSMNELPDEEDGSANLNVLSGSNIDYTA